MSREEDVNRLRQALRATFPYIVFTITFIVGTLLIIVWANAEETVQRDGGPTLLERAHSHNDYLRKRPLEDALALGFCSVEADIHLVEGELLVAHDRDKVKPGQTLSSLYLEPLWQRFTTHGSVYETSAPFTLLVDIKSEGASTFSALHKALLPFEDMLTRFSEESTVPGAVTVIVSGNRAVDTILASSPRLAGVDGRLSDLDGQFSAHAMPLISDNWFKHFTWRGKGEMPEADGEKLQDIVARAHARGMRVRFWATPQRPALWLALRDAGVDLLNADNLPRLRETLIGGEPESP
jgi:hypothetical protein